MCSLLGVTRSNYYRWLHFDPAKQKIDWKHVIELVLYYHEKYGSILGYRAIKDRIKRDTKEDYNDHTIYKVMKYFNIQSRIRHSRHNCTKRAKDAKSAPNRLNRDFNASAPNAKWVTDVTEFKYGLRKENKLYLSLIMDLYDRTPISYIINDHNNNPLVFSTFDKAIKENPNAHPLFHSDAGFQYTSPAFVKKLEKTGMVQSMSRVGKCLDNGPMEAFWGILKCEAYFARTFETREDLITAIDQWLHYYMYERPQRRFDLKTPYEVRKAALEAEEPVIYKIPENKRIERYKKEHYKNNTIRNCAIPSACPYANQLLTL